MIFLWTKTKIPFRVSRISNENTFSSPRFKLVSNVRPKIGIKSTTKDFKLSKVRWGGVKLRPRRFPIKN